MRVIRWFFGLLLALFLFNVVGAPVLDRLFKSLYESKIEKIIRDDPNLSPEAKGIKVARLGDELRTALIERKLPNIGRVLHVVPFQQPASNNVVDRLLTVTFEKSFSLRVDNLLTTAAHLSDEARARILYSAGNLLGVMHRAASLNCRDALGPMITSPLNRFEKGFFEARNSVLTEIEDAAKQDRDIAIPRPTRGADYDQLILLMLEVGELDLIEVEALVFEGSRDCRVLQAMLVASSQVTGSAGEALRFELIQLWRD